MTKWLAGQIAGWVVKSVLGVLFAAVCLVWGFAPEATLAEWLGNPPPWVLNPWTRIAVVVLGMITAIYLLIRYLRERAAEAQLPRNKYFSNREKDRIGEIFFHLKDLVDRDVRGLDLEVQQVWGVWSQRSNPPYSGSPLPLDTALEQVVAVAEKANDLANQIYEDLFKRNKPYRSLLNNILEENISKPIYDVREEAWRFKHHLNDCKFIYELAPGASDAITRLTIASMSELNRHRVILSSWTGEVLSRIEKYEKDVLGISR